MQDITKDRIKKDLGNLGIKPGDKLMVHSSLRSIGHVIGGADTVIDAVLESIGEQGLLMMPTFSYSYEKGNGTGPFNKRISPSRTGYITEVFRKREDVVRSDHPTHSVSAVGKNAKYYIAGHEETKGAFDNDTPLHKLALDKGRILLIGVGHEANSTIHVAEFLARLPFLDLPNRSSYGNGFLVQRDDGSIEKIPFPLKLSGCSHGFGKVDDIKGIEEIQKTGYIGEAHSRLIEALPLISLLIGILKEKPDFLLCDNEECEGCSRRRKRLRELKL
jgi:aminoglycoside 3-N-acetyltransferase